MKKACYLTLALIFALFLPAHAQNNQRSPVVIEMFTSQACAFCPKVEKLLQPLTLRDDVIVLMCHVGYYNKKQAPLGRDFCTNKQTAYIEQFDKNTHFTPQVVMNGHIEAQLAADGNITRPLTRAIEDQIDVIKIRRRAGFGYEFTLPDIESKDDIEIWYARFDRPIKAASSGSYRTSQFTYHHVVSDLAKVRNWQEGRNNLEVEIGPKQKGLAVFVQRKSDGRIIAAGQFKK